MRITKKNTLPFPPLKSGQLLNSIDMRRNETVTLEIDSKSDDGSFTINRKEHRLSELLTYPFIPTETVCSIHLRSFYQMLLIAEETLHLDESKKVTIYCTGTALIRASTFVPTIVFNDSLPLTNNVSNDIELVKLIHVLYNQLESKVSFRQAKKSRLTSIPL